MRYLPLTISLLLLGVGCTQNADPQQPTRQDESSIQPEVNANANANADIKVQNALKTLIETKRFALRHLNGRFSDESIAFEFIFHHPQSADLFKQILEKGNTPGRLYAMTGLYYKNRPLFDKRAGEFRASQEVVGVRHGCLTFPSTVAKHIAVVEKGKGLIGLMPVGYSESSPG